MTGSDGVSTLRAAALIAARDTRARLRSRSAIVIAFLAPSVLAGILSFALGGGDDFTTTVGVVDADGGPVASALVNPFRSGDLAETVTVEDYSDEVALREAVAAGDVAAGLVLPAGLLETVVEGGTAPVEVVRNPSAPVSGDVVEAVVSAVAARITAQRQAVATAIVLGAPESRTPELAEAAGDFPPAVELQRAGVAVAQRAAASYWGPAMAVFFVFFVVAFGPSSLLAEREQGTLARLHAAPIRPAAILLGKALGVFVLALVSVGTMWAVTSLVFGADWGDPLGVVLVALGFVVAAAATTALIATLARSRAQVEGVTSIVVFTFALLGGSFIELESLPEPVRLISLLTPNGWAMRAFSDLSAGEGVAAVLPTVGALVAFAVVASALTAPRIDRVLQPAGA
jgi:linearmycin/streptolysin S transport system permease protein